MQGCRGKGGADWTYACTCMECGYGWGQERAGPEGEGANRKGQGGGGHGHVKGMVVVQHVAGKGGRAVARAARAGVGRSPHRSSSSSFGHLVMSRRCSSRPPFPGPPSPPAPCTHLQSSSCALFSNPHNLHPQHERHLGPSNPTRTRPPGPSGVGQLWAAAVPEQPFRLLGHLGGVEPQRRAVCGGLVQQPAAVRPHGLDLLQGGAAALRPWLAGWVVG